MSIFVQVQLNNCWIRIMDHLIVGEIAVEVFLYLVGISLPVISTWLKSIAYHAVLTYKDILVYGINTGNIDSSPRNMF